MEEALKESEEHEGRYGRHGDPTAAENTSTVSPVTRITLDRYSTPLQSPSGRQTEIMSFSSALSAVHLH